MRLLAMILGSYGIPHVFIAFYLLHLRFILYMHTLWTGITSLTRLYKQNIPSFLLTVLACCGVTGCNLPAGQQLNWWQVTFLALQSVLVFGKQNDTVCIFQGQVIGSSYHWHVNLLLGLHESVQTGMLIYLNWSRPCSYKKALDAIDSHKLLHIVDCMHHTKTFTVPILCNSGMCSPASTIILMVQIWCVSIVWGICFNALCYLF